MVGITNSLNFDSFAHLSRYVLVDLRFPRQQGRKLETNAFTLSIFGESERTITRLDGYSFEKTGVWRTGASEIDSISAFYCDIDNANPDHPHLTRAKVEDRLHALGFSYFGYTSYSHTAEHEKFRVIIDLDRAVTRAEMLQLIVYLDHVVFGHQADMSIYDPAGCLFGPPFYCETFEKLDGASDLGRSDARRSGAFAEGGALLLASRHRAPATS